MSCCPRGKTPLAGGDPPPSPGLTRHDSKSDLQHLLRSPDLLASLLHYPAPAPILAHAAHVLHETLQQTSALAAQTTAQSQHLASTRSSVSANLIRVRGLEQSWRKKQGEMEERLERWSPRVLHGRLVGSISEGEGVCAGVEESWLEGGGVAAEREVEGWVRRVREGRRAVALRRERRARWDEGRVGGWR